MVTNSGTDGCDVKVDAPLSRSEINQVSGMNRDCSMDTNGCPDGRSIQIGKAETENKVNEAASAVTAPAVGSGCYSVDDSVDQSSESLPLTLHEVLAVDLNVEVCSRYHIRDPSLYSFICAQLFRRDEYTRHVRDVHATIHDAIDHWLEVRCPLAHCGCTFSVHRRLPSGASIIFSPLLESLGLRQTDHTFSAVEKSTSKEPENLLESSPAICTQIPTTTETLRLEHSDSDSTEIISPVTGNIPNEATASSLNRPQEYTPEMFTSRDFESAISAHPWTSRETKATEDSETDGLSLRCADDNYNGKEPTTSIAVYENGFKECTPEMFTSTEFSSAVFIRPRTSKEPTPSEDTEILRLTSLPFELLTRIASFLDSFSLCNLSLTCWLLRDVCRTLLRQQGLVVLEWQKDCSENPPHWKVSHQRWMFSTAFDPINQWTFTDQPSMSEHLKVCPFNVTRHWDTDRISLCQMVADVSGEMETD